jgi:hypothetical protein
MWEGIVTRFDIELIVEGVFCKWNFEVKIMHIFRPDLK